MAITQGVCTSFLEEILAGTHDFSADTFKVALYGSSATLGPDTIDYTSTGEVSGSGYTAGGATVSVAEGYPLGSGLVVKIDFDDVTWSSSTITAATGCLIYNSSKSNKAVAVFTFGAAVSSSNGDFVLEWPDPNTYPTIRLAG